MTHFVFQKIAELTNDRKINNYFHDQLYHQLDKVSAEEQEEMISEAIVLSSLGVSSEEDHKIIAYLKQHVRKIATDITGLRIESATLAKVAQLAFESRAKYPIHTIVGLYQSVEAGLKSLGFQKRAYPVQDLGKFVQRPHDLQKWMDAMRQIYYVSHQGLPFKEAFDSVTKSWDKMEKADFEAWVKYYQGSNQDKYKTAKYYQLDGDGPPIIPLDHLAAKLPGTNPPGMPAVDMYEDKSRMDRELKEMEARKKREEATYRKNELRKKIISRLQAAERIVTDPDAQEDLQSAIDMGLNKWLEVLHSLKRSIQTAPMRSASSPILQDLIVRQGNQLTSEGHPKAGKFLTKLAQEIELNPEPQTQEKEAPPQAAPAPAPEEEEESDAMKDFVKKMNNEFIDSDEVEDSDEAEDGIVVEAQALPEVPADPEPAIEVEVEPEPPEPADKVQMQDVTVPDIIVKLEAVADILRKRELPRQLAEVDLMMAELGIAGFFPQLAEAHKSALESNGYMSTRIDDILSKLRGSVEITNPIQLNSTPAEMAETTETLDQVRNNLEQAEEAEAARKAKRDQDRQRKEMEELEQEQTEQELAAPVEVEQATPTRVTP